MKKNKYPEITEEDNEWMNENSYPYPVYKMIGDNLYHIGYEGKIPLELVKNQLPSIPLDKKRR